MSTAVIGSKSKPDVEFKYGGRLGEFNGLSSQSHVSRCRVLPLGEFTVMISEPHATLQGVRIPSAILKICFRHSLFYFLAAVLRAAQPCRYCFYSVVQKCVFRPAGATHYLYKREIWRGPPCQISRLSGQKCGNTAPKTGKIWNFGHKFAAQGRLVCTIFTKFSAFVRVYR